MIHFYWLVFFGFLTLEAVAQCPQSGLKIESQSCGVPRDLKVSLSECTSTKLTWHGGKEQSYIIKANTLPQGAEEAIALQTGEVICNDGNCKTSVAVAEGVTVQWSVQAICHQKGVTFYSKTVKGPDTYIPICTMAKEPVTVAGFSIYPNPSTGVLNIDYPGSADGLAEVRIYDVNGKLVFTKLNKAVAKTVNHYQLAIQGLHPGSYALEIVNGDDKKRAKFVLLKR